MKSVFVLSQCEYLYQEKVRLSHIINTQQQQQVDHDTHRSGLGLVTLCLIINTTTCPYYSRNRQTASDNDRTPSLIQLFYIITTNNNRIKHDTFLLIRLIFVILPALNEGVAEE